MFRLTPLDPHSMLNKVPVVTLVAYLTVADSQQATTRQRVS